MLICVDIQTPLFVFVFFVRLLFFFFPVVLFHDNINDNSITTFRDGFRLCVSAPLNHIYNFRFYLSISWNKNHFNKIICKGDAYTTHMCHEIVWRIWNPNPNVCISNPRNGIFFQFFICRNATLFAYSL